MEHGKVLTVYLNSTLVLLQLLAFVAETRGSWVRLGHDQTWSNIHVPDISNLNDKIIGEALRLFSKIGKTDVEPLLRRIKKRKNVQKSIDEVALKMLGLSEWIERLEEVYDAVTSELEAMHMILETSRKLPMMTKRKEKRLEAEEEEKTEPLERWMA